ncbi:hypothetical protein LY76DRAFT_328260 [Colletotrichum caudatum]|nr:hypothetical protein LY76DRAFT_328260 [Colletotrichum caudatum]
MTGRMASVVIIPHKKKGKQPPPPPEKEKERNGGGKGGRGGIGNENKKRRKGRPDGRKGKVAKEMTPSPRKSKRKFKKKKMLSSSGLFARVPGNTRRPTQRRLGGRRRFRLSRPSSYPSFWDGRCRVLSLPLTFSSLRTAPKHTSVVGKPCEWRGFRS